MTRLLFAFTITLLFSASAYAEDGLVSIQSQNSVQQTVERLKSALKEKGMTIFANIDHAQGAKRVGKDLRPTQLVIFGNPKLGTVLMHCKQSIAIDLPQKALIWQDEKGYVWFSYNNPTYLTKRHGIQACDKTLQKIAHALQHFALIATSPSIAEHHATDAH